MTFMTGVYYPHPFSEERKGLYFKAILGIQFPVRFSVLLCLHVI